MIKVKHSHVQLVKLLVKMLLAKFSFHVGNFLKTSESAVADWCADPCFQIKILCTVYIWFNLNIHMKSFMIYILLRKLNTKDPDIVLTQSSMKIN